MQASAAAAQAAIFQRHAASFSPREAVSRVTTGAVKDNSQASVMAVAGVGLLPLLRELAVYARHVPLASKPRRDVHVAVTSKEKGDRAQLTLRCWSAVFPWELAYGLSNCPGEQLSPAGSVTGMPSGMLFVQPPASGLTHFWSGAIRTPLDVAFVYQSRMGFTLGDLARLDPFPSGDAAATNGTAAGSSHSVVSSGPQVCRVLETGAGTLAGAGLDPAQLRPGERVDLRHSGDMLLEIKEKHRLNDTFGKALVDAVMHLQSALCRRRRDDGAALEDDDVEFVALCYQLGLNGDILHEMSTGVLLSNLRRTMATGAKPAAASVKSAQQSADDDGSDDAAYLRDDDAPTSEPDQGHSAAQGLSSEALATLDDLARDGSIMLPFDVQAALLNLRHAHGAAAAPSQG
jgi:hypothetical protein